MAVKATIRRGGGKVNDELPSETIINNATKLLEVTTSNGMKIKFRKMTPANNMRLARIFTTKVVNDEYYMWCWFAASVAEINGDPVHAPNTELECEAIVERIGEEGIAALQATMAKNAVKR